MYNSLSSSTRILTSAEEAALVGWVKVITQNPKVVMEAIMQLTPVVWLIVVWGYTLVFHPPTQAQRHINVSFFTVCEIQTDSQFVLVWHGTNSSVSAGSGRVPGTNWLFQVSSFTWGAGHWPADISHPDRKWSKRNWDHVGDLKHPHLQKWRATIIVLGIVKLFSCAAGCLDPSARWPQPLRDGTAALGHPVTPWNRPTLTSLRLRCRRWPFSYTR